MFSLRTYQTYHNGRARLVTLAQFGGLKSIDILMKQFLYLLPLAGMLLLSACEEDLGEAVRDEKGDTLNVTADIPAPTVRSVDSKVPTTLKFGFSVTAEQVQDTVYFVLLPDSVAAPLAIDLMKHADVTEFPMEGNHFRSTFRSDLSAQTKYVVYASIKKGKQQSKMSSLALTTGQDSNTASPGNPTDNGGQEMPPSTTNPPPTTSKDTTAAPVLEPRGVPQKDLISLAVLVNGDQIEGTLHYLYFTESKNPENPPTPQELVDHRLTETVPMNGATIKKFNFPATSKTKYYIYGVLKVSDKLSRVVLLERATA